MHMNSLNLLHPVGENTRILLKGPYHLPVDTASHRSRLVSSATSLWYPQISRCSSRRPLRKIAFKSNHDHAKST